jgi:hypothetical protein
MRACHLLFIVILLYFLSAAGIVHVQNVKKDRSAEILPVAQCMTAVLGLSDLCLSTEARYTRHPAVSDRIAMGMDHPGAIDHFPSTLFWAPLNHL